MKKVEANHVDFQKVRKRRQRVQTVKRLVALGIVLAFIAGIISLNRFLINAGVTIRLSDFVESFGGAGYPIPVPGGIIQDVKSLGNDIAVINDTNLYVYSKNGKTMLSYQHMSDQTLVETNADRILIYNAGGRNYAILSKSKILLSNGGDYSILGGDLNGQGAFALITASEQSASRVIVFDQKFNEMFELRSENLVSGVSISPKGTRMAAIGVDTVGGEVCTLVWLYDFNVEKGLVKLELAGETPLDVQYLEDGRFSVLTNRQYRLFSSEGIQECSYSFSGDRVLAIERNGKQALLQLEGTGGSRLVLLDGSCAAQASVVLQDKVRDIAFGSSNIYVLSDTGITTYGTGLEPKSTFEMRGISQIHAVKDTLYYFDKEEIHILQ